jgi:hypothetical protein
MSVTVLVEASNGAFKATLVGAPGLEAVRPSRGEALDALRGEIKRRLASGELVELELEPRGVAALAGTFRDDPSLREICEEIYAERNHDRDRTE